MKIYKLNSFTTFLFSIFILGLVVFLPIVLIELLWNSTIGITYTDIKIDFWQSLILWLIVLVSLSILGVFKFEFAIETQDRTNKDLLKDKIANLKSKTEEKKEVDGIKNDIDETKKKTNS